MSDEQINTGVLDALRDWFNALPCDGIGKEHFDRLVAIVSRRASPHGEAGVAENWRDDPASDERWNAGVNYAIERLCDIFGIEPASINWDAATETLDGDVMSVLCNVLTAAYGDEWASNKEITTRIRSALLPTPSVETGRVTANGGE